MAERFEDNAEILKIVEKYLSKNKDLRFIQALHALGIISEDDRFYEEPNVTLKKVNRMVLKEEVPVADVQYPVLDHTESVASIGLKVTPLENNKKLLIKDVEYAKNMFLIITNNGESVNTITVKAGDAYPNSMLGDIELEVPTGMSAIQLADLSRFIRDTGDVLLEFAEDFKGGTCVIGRYRSLTNE